LALPQPNCVRTREPTSETSRRLCVCSAATAATSFSVYSVRRLTSHAVRHGSKAATCMQRSAPMCLQRCNKLLCILCVHVNETRRCGQSPPTAHVAQKHAIELTKPFYATSSSVDSALRSRPATSSEAACHSTNHTHTQNTSQTQSFFSPFPF
jgi:hypothetical protein